MSSSAGMNPRSEAGRAGLGINDKIDICRGAFACLVVSAHARELGWSMSPDSMPVSAPGWFLHYVLGTGIYWVMGFFVISGYCIQMSVERSSASGGFRPGEYLAARLTRVLPLYYLALVFAVAIEVLVGPVRPACWGDGLDARTLIYQVLTIQGCTQTFGAFVPSWSITNELFYYLIFAGLIVAFPRSKNAPVLCGLAACLIAGVAFQLVYSAGLKFAMVHKTGMMLGLGVNWFLGALVAQHRQVLCRNRGVVLASKSWPILLIGSIALLSTERLRPGFAFILAGIAFSLMLVDFLACDARRGTEPGGLPGLRRVAQTLGLASYPLYLFHGPVMLLVGTLMLRGNLAGDRHLVWGAAMLASLPIGVALGFVAERPIMAWRAGYLKRRRIDRPEIGVKGGSSPIFGTWRRGGSRIIREGV